MKRGKGRRGASDISCLSSPVRNVTGEPASLDDVFARLTKSRRPLTAGRLCHVTEKITRKDFRAFFARIE
jgi:hypothetical protein